MSDIFITENFLLQNDRAVELYHEFARPLPIIDYHCHLPPAEIAADRRFENLAEIWLAGDHYKWRAMRAAGVEERFCTGDASAWEKFQKWAETVPRTLRNPLYHWTHLELKSPLGISDRLLNAEMARGIWDECNAKLALPDFSARGIMHRMNVEVVCTTDDPTDSLEHHKAIAAERSRPSHPSHPSSPFATQVLPTFRPDRAMAVESPSAFNAWTDRLAAVAGIDVGDRFDRFLEAIHARHDYFHAAGCRLSDHGIETFYAADFAPGDASAAFQRVRRGQPLDAEQTVKFKSAVLYELAVMNHEKNWTQQFHFGALRNNNTRMFRLLGPDAGFDTIGEFETARPMARFFDRLDLASRLARTIVYNLNPAHNEMATAMIGNFQDGRTPGKMQFGSGWWFLDQKDGIERQLNVLSNLGLLSCFVGMLTDSRSFLSYARHEYFRRILCNILGTEMQQGLLPDDVSLVGRLVIDVCHDNAARYFGFA